MTNSQIVKQLLNGNHLSVNEIKQAEELVYKMNNAITSLKPQQTDFTRVNNDVNGNPRFVCHYLNLSNDYDKAIKLAKKIGGKKFHNKQYGGGLVFSSYNLGTLQTQINELKEN